jgi:CheY-like chemotaxis protein
MTPYNQALIEPVINILCLGEEPHVPSRVPDPEEESNRACRKRRVLLVEDNPTDLYVIREVVERSGLSVDLVIARDGQQALTYFSELDQEGGGCPDLVLLDLNLPKLSGIDVLRELRNQRRCGQVPVIVVTSSVNEKDRTATRDLGVDGYFHKPTDLDSYSILGELIKKFVH